MPKQCLRYALYSHSHNHNHIQISESEREEDKDISFGLSQIRDLHWGHDTGNSGLRGSHE